MAVSVLVLGCLPEHYFGADCDHPLALEVHGLAIRPRMVAYDLILGYRGGCELLVEDDEPIPKQKNLNFPHLWVVWRLERSQQIKSVSIKQKHTLPISHCQLLPLLVSRNRHKAMLAFKAADHLFLLDSQLAHYWLSGADRHQFPISQEDQISGS
jgi:hypothetical protein